MVLNLGLIFGGRSLEHPISILSAQSVFRALDPEKYNVIPILINRDGKWLSPSASEKILLEKDYSEEEQKGEVFLVPGKNGPFLYHLERSFSPQRLDVIFPVLHGPYGEDGCLQGLLEMIDVPYVGAGVLSSAMGMDKGFMKDFFSKKNLPQTKYMVLEKGEWEQTGKMGVTKKIEEAIEYPLFVKPAALGSSFGISKVNKKNELEKGLSEAFALGNRVLVEKMVCGREIECSVLGNDNPQVAGPGEVISGRDFYDYKAKYTEGEAELIFSPDLPQKIIKEARQLSLQAFKAMGCRGMARVDLFYTAEDQVVINEINTIPGFTPFSMYPKLWANEGLKYEELVDKLIQLALER